MKNYISEYLKIIAYTLTGLAFLVSSFYLLINYYHSIELSSKIYIGKNDIIYNQYIEKMTKMNENVKKYKSSKTKTLSLDSLYSKLSNCGSILKSDNSYTNIELNNYYGPYDIYKLGVTLQSDIINNCWTVNLSYLDESDDDRIKEISSYANNSINLISNQVSSALDELQNNGSYFFSTNITSSTIRNDLLADYQLIANSYDAFATLLLNMSETLNISESSNISDKIIGGDIDDKNIE